MQKFFDPLILSWQGFQPGDDFMVILKNLLAPAVLIVVATVIFQSIVRYISHTTRYRGLTLPPGPPRRWIIGNLLQMPKSDFLAQTIKWKDEYGPIYYIQLPNKKFVFLNTAKAAFDLVESRSIYADRPRPQMTDMAGRTLSIFLTPFLHPRFKILRRLLQDGLNARAVKSYRPIQIEENRVFLRGLATTPEDFRSHIRRNVNAIVVKAAYGYQITGNDDSLVNMLEYAFQLGGTISVPGKYLVELIPSLRYLPKWFPGAGFKRYAEYVKQEVARCDDVPFVWAKKQIETGSYIESFTSKHLLENDVMTSDPETLESIKWASSALYIGGGDSTTSSLSTIFLALALHPEVQRRAQADIDLVAPNRLPTFDDFDSLPYIMAIIRESARWGPTVPLGIPHRVMEDDVYENYLIPKGATIFINTWAIGHDEEVYPDPFKFDPSRHMGDNPQLDPFKFTFGMGRRACPGAHMTEMTLFLNVAALLAVFNLSKCIDENGKEIEPKIEWVNGITSHLKPFDIRIVPRSEDHLALIESEHYDS